MNSITQNMRFRESLLKYAERYGINEAARKYNMHKSYIYRWRAKRLASNKNINSLKDKPRIPKTSPRLHTQDEEILIKNYARRNPHSGVPELWQKLLQ